MGEYCLHLSSTRDQELFPQNRGDKFTVQLPSELNLSTGGTVALIDIRVLDNPLKRDFYVLCSLCEADPIHNLQILRRVWVKGGNSYQTRYAYPLHIGIKPDIVKSLSIELHPLNGLYTRVPVNSCEVTLLIKKHG